MRFLVDAQLPTALARRLVELGHDAQHVGDLDMNSASDSRIWNHALESGAVIVSKDEDFARRRSLALSGPRVVWVRMRNSRRQELLRWFDMALPRVLDALENGEALIELI